MTDTTLKSLSPLAMSATQMAACLRDIDSDITSVELTSCCIDRILELNPFLNAVTQELFDEAMKQARMADQRYATAFQNYQSNGADNIHDDPFASLPPFLGVPITVKETFRTQGCAPICGLVSRGRHNEENTNSNKKEEEVLWSSSGNNNNQKNKRGRKKKIKKPFTCYTASTEGDCVKRLREAGFIVVGVTNVSELCMWLESSNKYCGITRNPYDLTKIVGGSSGGEAAIIASECTPFPVPYVKSMNRILTSGPMTRRAEDLWPLYTILKRNGKSSVPTGQAFREDCFLPKLNRKLRVFVLDKPGAAWYASAPSSEVLAGLYRVVDALQLDQACASVVNVNIDEDLPLLRHGLDLWSARLTLENTESFRDRMRGEGTGQSGVDRGLWLVPRFFAELMSNWFPFVNLETKFTLPALGLCVLEEIVDILQFWFPSMLPHWQKEAFRLSEQIDELLGDDGILLCPTFPVTAPQHALFFSQPSNLFDFCYTCIFNATEHPVTQVPIGLDSKGLPLGVQVVVKKGNDRLGIQVANLMETLGFGWTPKTKKQKIVG
eukprot:g4234.t1